MVGRSLAEQFGRAVLGGVARAPRNSGEADDEQLSAPDASAEPAGLAAPDVTCAEPDGAAEAADDLQPAAEDEGSSSLRILAAEDNPNNRQVLELILGMIGAEVTFAVNGAEAVDIFRQAVWDLVLMDVQMPVMDGLNATKAIRAFELAERRGRTPVIAVTANAMSHHVDECLRAGMDAHVAKPVSAGLLFDVMERLTSGEPACAAAA